jgi:hypothetical protein
VTRAQLLHFGSPDGDENPAFSAWWQSWPKEHRIAKGAARREWYKLRPTKQQAAQMTEAVQAQAKGTRWKLGYVPTPANWLRDERWDDYVEAEHLAPERCTHQPTCPNPLWCKVVQSRERDES